MNNCGYLSSHLLPLPRNSLLNILCLLISRTIAAEAADHLAKPRRSRDIIGRKKKIFFTKKSTRSWLLRPPTLAKHLRDILLIWKKNSDTIAVQWSLLQFIYNLKKFYFLINTKQWIVNERIEVENVKINAIKDQNCYKYKLYKEKLMMDCIFMTQSVGEWWNSDGEGRLELVV